MKIKIILLFLCFLLWGLFTYPFVHENLSFYRYRELRPLNFVNGNNDDIENINLLLHFEDKLSKENYIKFLSSMLDEYNNRDLYYVSHAVYEYKLFELEDKLEKKLQVYEDNPRLKDNDYVTRSRELLNKLNNDRKGL